MRVTFFTKRVWSYSYSFKTIPIVRGLMTSRQWKYGCPFSHLKVSARSRVRFKNKTTIIVLEFLFQARVMKCHSRTRVNDIQTRRKPSWSMFNVKVTPVSNLALEMFLISYSCLMLDIWFVYSVSWPSREVEVWLTSIVCQDYMCAADYPCEGESMEHFLAMVFACLFVCLTNWMFAL